MELDNQFYIAGNKSLYSYLNRESQNFPLFTKLSVLKNQDKIIKALINPEGILCLKTNNELELSLKNYAIGSVFKLKLNDIKDISCGSRKNFCVLQNDGTLYYVDTKGVFQNNKSVEKRIPFLDQNNKKENRIQLVQLNTKSNEILVDSVCVEREDLFVLWISTLLVTGALTFIQGGIERFRSGSSTLFLFTCENTLFGYGSNNSGKLGIGLTIGKVNSRQVSVLKNKNEENVDLKADQIRDVVPGISHSILLTKQGELYSCGSLRYSGHGGRGKILYFSLIKSFQEMKINQIACSVNKTLVLTEDKLVYGWGFDSCNEPNSRERMQNRGTYWDIPRKLKLPSGLVVSNSFRLYCAEDFCCVYNHISTNSCIRQDFKLLFENNANCDSFITNKSDKKIPVQKILVENRTNSSFDHIEKILTNFTEKEIDLFLKWVYYDHYETSHQEPLKKIFDSFNLTFPPKVNELSIKESLLELYNDEDSKDFFILVKDEDEDDEGEDNDDEEEYDDEDQYEKIPVHKFVLLARSGLFRNMFQNLSEKEKNMNQIKDYTGKSIESLEILIKYFYTDSIELTADDDPELIVEELSDAKDYFQLNEDSNLNTLLNSIKNQYNLL
ncbi:hypothetical protein M0813_13651 [Anaeramoeba flamelloides]|uniref:BTB domain-containing protein n=1 Tax=Anaeramoeba flamelloides TaxID=1746091 RepID=A0ABQ8Z7T2_9EUKA|nr:hypothetical protein M0813_13651 [Anaeramoeba flamelloides]